MTIASMIPRLRGWTQPTCGDRQHMSATMEMRDAVARLGLCLAPVLAASCAGTKATSAPASTVGQGPALIASAGSIAFDDDRTLFVGDSKNGVVHAFELPASLIDDQSAVSLGSAGTFEGVSLIEDLNEALSALLNAQPDEVVINDLVVHSGSKQIFLSVHQGRGPNPSPYIVKVNDGRLERVNLRAAKHSSTRIKNTPTTQTLEFGQLQSSFAITDIDYYQGEIFVAGLSTGVFASKLRRIAYPFDGEFSETSIEIWHAVHAQFETRAPIITQTIEVLEGEPTLIAVYACTPLVRIPLKALVDGAKVRGEMIGELGFGNTPIDIITYRDPSDSRDYVLVTNTNRSATRVALADIATADAMPVNAPNNFGPAGVGQYQMPVSDASHLAMMGEQWAVLVRRNPGDLSRTELHTLPLPFFFDRRDHIVEMNWPDGPDPFGYRRSSK